MGEAESEPEHGPLPLGCPLGPLPCGPVRQPWFLHLGLRQTPAQKRQGGKALEHGARGGRPGTGGVNTGHLEAGSLKPLRTPGKGLAPKMPSAQWTRGPGPGATTVTHRPGWWGLGHRGP